MAEYAQAQSTGGRRVALGLGLSMVAGVALAWLPRLAGSETAATTPESRRSESAIVGSETMVSETPGYECLSRVVWSDHTRGVTSDLEDAEGLEAVAGDGWELVHVIVPFAQTRHLDVSYPGNTRKLIAYYRRPRGLEET